MLRIAKLILSKVINPVVEVNPELVLVEKLIETSQVDDFVKHVEEFEGKLFPSIDHGYGVTKSKLGCIDVCNDIMGYEVRLWTSNGHRRGLLDCRPSDYNLSKEDADKAYSAIIKRYQKDRDALNKNI